MLRKIVFFCFLCFIKQSLCVENVQAIKGANGAMYIFYYNDVIQFGHGQQCRILAGLRIDQNNEREPVAMKLVTPSEAAHEKNIYETLEGNCSIPKFYDVLKLFGSRYVVITKLMGPNFVTLMKSVDEHFSIKTAMMVGCQMLNILKSLHKKNIVFCDVKPEHFVIDNKNASKIRILGFESSQKDGVYKNHKGTEENLLVKRTPHYDSIYAHHHKILRPNDDIESLGYMLIKFVQGELPWDYVSFHDNEGKWEKIFDQKQSIKENLRGPCKDTLLKFIKYAKKFTFKKDSDYKELEKLLLAEVDQLDAEERNRPLDWLDKVYTKPKKIVDDWIEKNIDMRPIVKKKTTLQEAILKRIDEIEEDYWREKREKEQRRLERLDLEIKRAGSLREESSQGKKSQKSSLIGRLPFRGKKNSHNNEASSSKSKKK